MDIVGTLVLEEGAGICEVAAIDDNPVADGADEAEATISFVTVVVEGILWLLSINVVETKYVTGFAAVSVTVEF